MDCIVLHVTYTCKPGMAGPFVLAVKEAGLQKAIRGEEGCLQYDYHLSCEGEDRVVLLERWADEEALRRHSAQPHMQRLAALKPRYVLDTRVERFS